MNPQQFQTSFIPKKPLVENTKSRARAVDIFSIVAILICLGSLGYYGYVYLQHKKLVQEVEVTKATIKSQQSDFSIAELNSFVSLDKKIKESRKVLEAHLESSAIFNYIADLTLESVQFTDFSYSVGSKDTTSLSLKGIAPTPGTIAYQSQVLSERVKQGEISDLVVGDLVAVQPQSSSSSGQSSAPAGRTKYSFTIKMSVNKNVVNAKNRLENSLKKTQN
jgi:hypothetical protein